MTHTAKDKLIVALDLDSAERALDLFDLLCDVAGMFKVGSQLFTAAGPDLVRRIVAKGGQVFLDLKFHDIPNTVAAAARAATRLGVSILNVHASGGVEMMRRAAQTVAEVAVHEGLAKPEVIAVTVLTSLDRDQLRQIGVDAEVDVHVKNLARLAAQCGLDGVVASPHEIEIIRQAVAAPGFLIVTPGVRTTRVVEDDQRRVMTAAAAIRAGADYVVVGRPILNAPDPMVAARAIVDEIDGALRAVQAQISR